MCTILSLVYCNSDIYEHYLTLHCNFFLERYDTHDMIKLNTLLTGVAKHLVNFASPTHYVEIS